MYIYRSVVIVNVTQNIHAYYLFVFYNACIMPKTIISREKQFKVPENKSLVIRNAVEKISYEEKPKDKINLIYHTTPWRGLANLIKPYI